METKRKKFNLTAEDIAAGKYGGMELIDPLWWSVSIYDGKEKYDADLAPFTAAQRGVFAVLWYDSEVCNGGHDQFLSNSTGIVWADALAGLKLIGADKCAEILERVIKKCGGSIPFDRNERNDMLDRLTADPDSDGEYLDVFRDDDDEYYDYNEEIYTLTQKYAQEHPEEFVFCGEIDVPANC